MERLSREAYNDAVQHLRETEYPMLQDAVYLDHAGSTLCSRSLMTEFASEMTSLLYGNPHSGSAPSQLSTTRIEDIRLRLLDFFNADPDEYDLVFVPNATAGVKLVVEGMRALEDGFHFAYHQACHTSLVGAREEAKANVCLDDSAMCGWLNGHDPLHEPSKTASAVLFAYPTQSQMDGKRFPLAWPKRLREHRMESSLPLYTLLDAASLCATSRLDLSDPNFMADFTVLSLYKIFGFPDLGALIVRRSAESVFDQRRYFGGGTVDIVVCGREQWHAPKSQFLHERLEDGTLPFHNIIALDIALRKHRSMFGTMDDISSHTSYLANEMLSRIRSLRHGNGSEACVTYTQFPGTDDELGVGPIVSFNLRNSRGAWASLSEFEKLANLKSFYVRTGGVCNPGGIAEALSLQPWEMRRNFSAGFRCGTDSDVIAGKPAGVIRVSFGAMSTMSDVDRFIGFLEEFFVDSAQPASVPCLPVPAHIIPPDKLMVKRVMVYPVKSCGGFNVPPAQRWEVRPEGLAWDREWCLLHRGSRQALSQKRCPKMALLQPTLDLDRGELRIRYRGKSLGEDQVHEVSVPLSANPALFEPNPHNLPSRVCGDEVQPQTYASSTINNFFTEVLGFPCVLARFPPGGRGLASRSSKLRKPAHQQVSSLERPPGAFPDPPSPPDSDSESQDGTRILLSNESPILMVHESSIDALNERIRESGGTEVAETAFRANVIIGSASCDATFAAYSEDAWSSVRIGQQDFKLLGGCRRCQMVCINQDTGQRSPEPFVTLAKTRRFDGKVYFGVHMRHAPRSEPASESSQYPTIEVGASVSVDPCD